MLTVKTTSMELRQDKTRTAKTKVKATPIDTDVLTGEILTERVGKSLEAKIECGMQEDIGIHRHNHVNYVWRLTWKVEPPYIDFLMEVWEVRPYMREGKETSRTPRLLPVIERQFQEKVS